MPELNDFLTAASNAGASWLCLHQGERPWTRVNGQLEALADAPVVSAEDLARFVDSLLNEQRRERFAAGEAVDLAYETPSAGRFRCTVSREHAGLTEPSVPALIARKLAAEPPSLKDLNLHVEIDPVPFAREGLVLISGAPGSGRTSTLAAIVDLINAEARRHVVSLENPIELVHAQKSCVIHQRELGRHFSSYEDAIFATLWEDADVLVIDELAGHGAIRRALEAAERGVLVLAAFAASSVVDALERILGSFPAHEVHAARTQLSLSLAGAVHQVLLPRAGGTGSVVAAEVLLPSHAVANHLREGRTQDLVAAMNAGKSLGMHTLDDSLDRLLAAEAIDVETVQSASSAKARFENQLAGTARR